MRSKLVKVGLILRFIILAAVLPFVGGCGPLPGKPKASDVPIKPRDVRDFAGLYRENCVGCHGRDGLGNGAMALANPVYLAIVSDEALRRAIANGVPGSLMPPFAQSAGGMLNDDQVNILVDGMRTNWARPEKLQGVVPPAYAATSPGDAHRGAEVFVTFCAHCHGPEGKGTSKSGSIVDGSYLALVSDQSLRATVIAGRPDLGHPDWRGCLPDRALTEPQVTDVVTWLAARRPATPGQPYPTAQANP